MQDCSLQNAGLYQGKTLHSFKAGSALTLAFLGNQLSDIVACWMALCAHSFLLLMLAQVLQPGGPSELLSVTRAATGSAATECADFNNLRNFGATFPPAAN